MPKVLAQNETLYQWRNVVVFGFMTKYPNVAMFDINVTRSQIVQNNAKKIWITIDKYGSAVIAQTRYTTAKQSSKKGVRNPSQGLSGR